MEPLIAVYDACILYSAFLRDFMVRLAIHWTAASSPPRPRNTGLPYSGRPCQPTLTSMHFVGTGCRESPLSLLPTIESWRRRRPCSTVMPQKMRGCTMLIQPGGFWRPTFPSSVEAVWEACRDRLDRSAFEPFWKPQTGASGACHHRTSRARA